MVIACGPGSHHAGRYGRNTTLHYSPGRGPGWPHKPLPGRLVKEWAGRSRTFATGIHITAPQARQVQVFGTKKNADTRKALRFFSERRVLAHFVDFQERPPALGELRRFSERFGAAALVDRSSKRFQELGLQRSMYSDDWWLRRLTEEPLMIRQPLVRFGPKVTVGLDEDAWRSWLA